MLPEQQQRILGYFIEEAKEHLNTIEQGLLNLQSTIKDPEMLNEIFRAAHSIKGGAAMLGLSSIQLTAHRLEDCFKVLKEHPIRVDQKLESLFLDVSDALKALLENLEGPFGLTEDTANQIISKVEPTFGYLNEHLNLLVQQKSSGGKTTDSDCWQISYNQVMQTLREMLQLFKQDCTPETRQKLQNCCNKLAQIGAEANCPNWSNLCHAAGIAIANQENSFLTLAKIIITDIKKALELALAAKEHEITISQQLEVLIPHNVETLDNSNDFGDERLEVEVVLSLHPPEEFVSANTYSDKFITSTAVNFSQFATESESIDCEPDDSITSLSELSDQISSNIDDNIDKFDEFTAEAQLIDFDLQDSIANLPELSYQFNSDDEDEASIHSSFDTNAHGPEVGIAELSTLAQLFERETPDLHENWDIEEEILESEPSSSEIELTIDNAETEDISNDFAELLSLDRETSIKDSQFKTAKEDLTLIQLFGDDFLEEENLKQQNQQIIDNTQIHQLQTSNELTSLEIDVEDSFDELFSLSDNQDLIKENSENTPQTQVNWNLDHLFNQAEEDSNLNLTIDESEFGDFFDTVSATSPVFSPVEEDLNLWIPEDTGKQQQPLQAPLEQDTATALEELLFAATSANQIFGDRQQSASGSDLELGDLDIDLSQEQQLDLALSVDGDNDLFEELVINDSITALPVSDRELSDTPIQTFSQQPEALELSPAFTDSSTEISQIDLSQSPIEQEPSWLDVVEENNNENLEILFEDSSTPNFDDLQAESTDFSLGVPQEQLADDRFSTIIQPDLDFTDASESEVLQTSSEIADIDTNPGLVDIWLSTETIVFETEKEADVVKVDFSEDGAATPQDDEHTAVEDIAVAPTELVAVAFDFHKASEIDAEENAFTDFDELPEEDVTSNTNIQAVSEQEFIGFNELLKEDGAANADFEPVAEQEFGDLDELLKKDVTANIDVEPVAEQEFIGFNELLKEDVTANADFEPVAEQEFGDLDQLLKEDVTANADVEPVSEQEFGDLDELLKEDVTANADVESVAEQEEFADLEELLALNQDEDIAAAQPTLTDFSKAPSKPVSSPEIDNEFKDLEGMVGRAMTPGTINSPGGRNSGWSASRFEQLMKVPVKHLDDLSNLVGELVVNRNTLEQDQERLRQSLDNLLIQVHQLSDVGSKMQELYERSLLEASLLASRKNSGFTPIETDRGFSELEMDRFTPFHILSQEIIELIVRVRESASDIDFVTEETERVARQFRQVTSQLQEGLTRARMEPFSQATDLLPRGVRDNSIKYGKQVELIVQGRDTLIDKMILEHLKTPLTHLLNNAIAHGVEMPNERQAQGKRTVGIITLNAFHQGNQTVISVSDDGAGIDPERVKAKAMKVGLITPAQAKIMSPIEVYDLLFQPGFSTKDQADDLAGRGVGLDVVRTKISEIRGTITIDSTIGKGTTFTIRLPLTLSICKALCCVSDKARIAFPMDGVEDTLDLPVRNIQEGADGQKFISWRDRVLPFKPLKELLTLNRQLSRGNVYGGNRDDDMVSVIVVRSATTMVALQVDQVLSEQEIVIKQFEGPAPKPVGVAGATVLGDGRIMPIADVLEIIDIFQGRTAKQSAVSILNQKGTPDQTEVPATKIDPTVLIIDDSITVRELLSLTFNKAGYRVEQARDGQEAWDKLRSGLPCDLVFCDIEMPRCDGLELLSRIQKDSNLNHLPIAMLTSRGADKHRQMAISLGASGYFTKPYLEEALLEAASRMLKGEKLISSTNA
ncbi:MAG: response regulator [Chlorogloeopsis fritschii C42_A2020_084]|uniref:hybrid sensor histidine kinase/response regulator n=1 Tax=Chlorogloeopsis fritschii TaxID=1124 RepID=UPI0019F93D58|nr:response regulator [Chlorogloeopsis fritschii]MBF2007832.1 response regulator [Chlorogloeopsis fritschii C42_A2020_084]